MKNSPYFIESLSRGLSLLSLVAENPTPLSLTDLSKRRGLSTGAVQRLTFTLQQLGYIDRDGTDKKFRPGPRVQAIGFSVIRNMDLNKIAHPYLEEAEKSVGETVNLAVLDGIEIVYVERIVSLRSLHVSISIGSRRPLYSTSMGKVFLAFMPGKQREDVLARMELAPFTLRTIRSERDLKVELERVKARGFATSNEEMEIGIRSVAAPIRNFAGAVVAAVNFAAPTSRVSVRKLETVLSAKVMEVAEKISFRLGGNAENVSGARLLHAKPAGKEPDDHKPGTRRWKPPRAF